MVAEHKYINIDDIPDLIELADEIREGDEPVALRLAGVDVAIVAAASRSEIENPPGDPAELGQNPIMSLAGTWSEVDTDALIEQIYERRGNTDRRSIEW